MRYALKRNDLARIRYSPSERRAFAALRGRRRINTKDIARSVYNGRREPRHAVTTTVGTLKSLQLKVKLNKETFRIMRSKRRGPHPVEFWIE